MNKKQMKREIERLKGSIRVTDYMIMVLCKKYFDLTEEQVNEGWAIAENMVKRERLREQIRDDLGGNVPEELVEALSDTVSALHRGDLKIEDVIAQAAEAFAKEEQEESNVH